MDIINWVYLLKSKLVKTKVQDPEKDLLILGNNVSYVKRGDKYQSYGMTVKDFAEYVNESLAGNCPIQMNFKPGSIGEKVSFRKESGTDPSENRDIIIPGLLEITRGNNGGGIYNIAQEGNFNGSVSPVNTYWNTQYVDDVNTSWASLWDVQNRSYTSWRSAGDGIDDYVIPQYVGMPAVMRYDDGGTVRYWLIMFTEWGVGSYNEYGFAYDRYEILPEVYFEKPNYNDDAVDIISPGVHIKRNANGGLYNAITESYSEQGASPRNTKWNSSYIDERPGYSGWDDLSNLESRKYTSFVDALDGSVGNNIDGEDLIMWDMTTDLYYKITFDSWTQNGEGGGFAYYRTVIPQSCGIKFADGTVMNTAPTGSGGGSPIAVSGTSIYSTNPPAGPDFNTSNGIFLGQNAGQTALYASESIFLGLNAGSQSLSASNSNFFGYYSGYSASGAFSSNFLGYFAGSFASSAFNSNFFGNSAGSNAYNAQYSNFLGYGAGNNAYSAARSNFLGLNAGSGAQNAFSSNFLGHYAGYNATNAHDSNFFGFYAGYGATNAEHSNFLGNYAGYGASSSNGSNFLGLQAGQSAVSSSSSNFIGVDAGNGAVNCAYSNFLGRSSGVSATTAENSNFLGYQAGYDTTGAYNCNFFGPLAGQSSTGNNVNAFGNGAAINNQLSGQTIFSNSSMPTFANHAAAAAAITVGGGASAGNTYLYHNQATNSIGAVRL